MILDRDRIIQDITIVAEFYDHDYDDLAREFNTSKRTIYRLFNHEPVTITAEMILYLSFKGVLRVDPSTLIKEV